MGVWGRVLAILSIIALESLGLFGIHDPKAEAGVSKSPSDPHLVLNCDSGARIEVSEKKSGDVLDYRFENLARVMDLSLIQITQNCLEDYFVEQNSLEALKEARELTLGVFYAALEEDDEIEYAIEILLNPQDGPIVVEASILKAAPRQESFNLGFTKVGGLKRKPDDRLSKL